MTLEVAERPRKTAGMAMPTARARRLGQALRTLREHRGLSQGDAARAAGMDRLKLNRYENAKVVKPDPVAVARLCALYGAAETDALVQLARDAGKVGWWTAYGDIWQGSYVADEDMADSIRTWQGLYIPGLLQTEDYARAVIKAGRQDGPAAGVHKRVQARMARRVLLNRTDPPAPTLTAVLDESVLHRQVCPPAAMADQMRYLMRPRPNVTIQVLPFTAGAVAAMESRFTILTFPADLGFDPVVYAEDISGEVYLESVPLAERATVAFEQVTASAASPEQSLGMIAAACDRYA